MEEVVKEYKRAKTVLLTVSPFIGALLNKARVIVTPAVPTAAVDRNNNILINPKFFMNLSEEDRVFILAHEAMHWAFLDPQREQGRDHRAWNVVCDAVNNNALLEVLRPSRALLSGMVTLEKLAEATGVPPSELRNLTKERLYDMLPRVTGQQGNSQDDENSGSADQGGCEGSGQNLPQDEAIGDDLGAPADAAERGEVIQEGSKSIYGSDRKALTPDELREAVKRAVAEAEQFQKMRGTMPAGLQRLVDGLLRPKVPWKTLLRQALKDGLGRTTTQSWKRLSRRHRDYPGRKKLVTPTVWVGVDTSGSIGEEELQQFLGEIYGIARQTGAKVVVVPWDAEVYDPIPLRSPGQIANVAKGLRGGGGTDPTPFLRLVQKRMRPLDAVVILSDGYIGAPEHYERDARAVNAKASVSIFVSTGAEVRWSGWRFVKLE